MAGLLLSRPRIICKNRRPIHYIIVIRTHHLNCVFEAARAAIISQSASSSSAFVYANEETFFSLYIYLRLFVHRLHD